MTTLPDELVQQFRTVALERLVRIESSWNTVLTTFGEGAATALHRELHTLKGESKMLGFSDVNLVSHKLEDMLEVARSRGYAVDDDFDLAVNMAVRFMAMLVRKKVGAHLGGIDLPGFIRQIDGILSETRPRGRCHSTTGSIPLKPASPEQLPMPAALRQRLAPVAVDGFIEYAVSRGPRRDRLRSSWNALRDLIGIQRAVIGPAQLAKHEEGAQSLARELGKQVNLRVELENVEATAEMLAALDTAMLHIIRNAIDHGIEPPSEREAAGKPATGSVHVTCGIDGDHLKLAIEDDGRGISFEHVRARALEIGLLSARGVDIEERWLDLICQPGFSTRREITEVSGRGIGLDAVRTAIAEVGGTMTAKTGAGHGTSWLISIPLPKISFEAHLFRIPGVAFPIAVDGTWRLTRQSPSILRVLDLAHALGLTDEHTARTPCFFERGGFNVGIIAHRTPHYGMVRRLVAVPPPSPVEVVIVDTIEALLVHPDRWFSSR